VHVEERARWKANAATSQIAKCWVVVAKTHQGRGLSTHIVGELLTFAKNENVFATTRPDERVMRYASDYGFEINGKPYPSGRGYDLVLYLRNPARFPDAK
jgi:GNAT superfamily N-acetyltransferase